ncbi:hypothetical protein AC579_8221 [Pseudocercospora musae]|uniref:Uncharacterized protein n=1 Tax=Pseudocercospora musae TaxID=113226 RepID=A0A139IVY4_9PEZI|nr:hypothetical protein AC579_8221 [Pseudocercospora musae]
MFFLPVLRIKALARKGDGCSERIRISHFLNMGLLPTCYPFNLLVVTRSSECTHSVVPPSPSRGAPDGTKSLTEPSCNLICLHRSPDALQSLKTWNVRGAKQCILSRVTKVKMLRTWLRGRTTWPVGQWHTTPRRQDVKESDYIQHDEPARFYPAPPGNYSDESAVMAKSTRSTHDERESKDRRRSRSMAVPNLLCTF